MALRLSIVSEHASRMGEKAARVFGVHGGSIGRATDNEWILPDPERYLSGKHARIDFRAGTYYLVDTSSNGTFVNGSTLPLGKFHEYKIKDGDHVRIGEFELLVTIDASNDFPPEEGAIVAHAAKSPSKSAKKSTANDLGESLDLSELLELSGSLQPISANNAYGQALTSDPANTPGEATGTPWHMMTRPLKNAGASVQTIPTAPPPPATPRAPARSATPTSAPTPVMQGAPIPILSAAVARSENGLFDADFDTGLAAFCRGAGIDPRAITPDARGAALTLAGQLFRESILGLMDLNQGRQEFRNRFRIAAADDTSDSPLNFSKGIDENLLRLLTTLSTRSGSVVSVREQFRDQKAQNTASLVAMRAAFDEFLQRVDPKELEERFERSTKRGVFGTQNKGKYWDLYVELFPGLAQRPTEGFPHLFVETFAKAYTAKLRKLAPPPRKNGFNTSIDEENDKAVGEA